MPEHGALPAGADRIFDVAVVGAGVVGAAIARELARYALEIALLDANPDVGMGTSKASTAIWHTGFDAKPGTLEAALMRRSHPLLEAFMQETGSPFERIGGLLIAWNPEQRAALPSLLEKAHANGVNDVQMLTSDEVYRREPHLGPGALAGLWVPGEGILCTFTIPLALATQAVANGVTLHLNYRVRSVGRADGLHVLSDGMQELRARWLVNAAGLFSDEIDAALGHHDFTVRPRRGELIIYDKLARRLVQHVLLPVPTATTKGVLISPTIYGNVLLGPTAEDLDDKTATHTSADGLQAVLEKGRAILPELMQEEVTATYAGLRAATEHSDYQIRLHASEHYLCAGGIRSTGVSACMGIAEYVRELLAEGGLPLRTRPDFQRVRMPNIGEAFPRPFQSAERIAENPEYGTIVCHCEKVSLGELKDALHAPLPATTLDGLRRRTRATQGRCQGFNCQAAVQALLQGGRAAVRQEAAARREVARRLPEKTDVLIVGAGPAGLAAALELKRLGVQDVLVAEREGEAGGTPRFCGHTGFGLRDLHRVLTGPAYARHYRELAAAAQIHVETSMTVTEWGAADGLSYTSPRGVGRLEAKAVLLATGVRERPRAARLVPGSRPQGVFTTGSLQRFVYEQRLPVGRRAVIVGAEIVSLSAVLTLMHAGVRVLHLITELPRHQLYPPIFLPAKILFADMLARSSILSGRRLTAILGRSRVEAVEVTDLMSGGKSVIECDTVVFTGDWIPEHELAARAGVDTLRPSLGPQVDASFRTSRAGVFAAGNVLRGVETADWAALEGRRAAGEIARYLHGAAWPERCVRILAEPPLGWVCPNLVAPGAGRARFRFRADEFRERAHLQLRQGRRVLYDKCYRKLEANTSMNLDDGWVSQVDFDGEPLQLGIRP